MININANKKVFITVVKENVRRDGIDKLLEYLEQTDFFIAPCSTKFHLNVEGGLCEHSLNVYQTLLGLYSRYRFPMYVKSTQSGSQAPIIETLTIVSLFHDLCKANYYKKELKSVKVGNAWTQQQVYVTADQLPLGHGEKSVILLEKFIDLTVEEMLAIRWHMAGFDNAVKGGEWSVSTAQSMSKLVGALQCADMIASHLMED